MIAQQPANALLDALLDAIAERVVERLRGPQHDMVSQGDSPLGRKRHCAAVRRRLAAGEPGASVVGRRHLLSRGALDEELGRVSRATKAPATPSRLAEIGR